MDCVGRVPTDRDTRHGRRKMVDRKAAADRRRLRLDHRHHCDIRGFFCDRRLSLEAAYRGRAVRARRLPDPTLASG